MIFKIIYKRKKIIYSIKFVIKKFFFDNVYFLYTSIIIIPI